MFWLGQHGCALRASGAHRDSLGRFRASRQLLHEHRERPCTCLATSHWVSVITYSLIYRHWTTLRSKPFT